MAKKSAATLEAEQDSPVADATPATPAVAAATLEAAVQVAALLINREGSDPGGIHLLQKCGQVHVDAVAAAKADPEQLATWACAEARRRSPALNHKAIVAQAIG